MLYGKSANLDHLRVFECQSFSCNLHKRDKFTPKVRIAMFVRYYETLKGYRKYDLDTHTIFVSRDYKFQKYAFPFKPTSNIHDEESLFSQSTMNYVDPSLPPPSSSTPQDKDDNSAPALIEHEAFTDPESTVDLHALETLTYYLRLIICSFTGGGINLPISCKLSICQFTSNS